MKTILTSLVLLIASFSFAQNNLVTKKMANQIKKNIGFASSFVYSQNPNHNIDSVCLFTAKQTVQLMKGNNFSTAYYNNLGLKLASESKDKNAVKIFNFGYDCGGTRRFITHPIIQWKNAAGKTFAFNFSSKINCNFFEIHPLKTNGRNLYLLIGVEAGDGSCYQGMAYVIEIKGDYLITNNAVFANRPYLNLCNREFEFDAKTQILTSLLAHGSFLTPLKSALIAQGDYSKDKKANAALENLIGENYKIEPSIFYLKFNGHQFIKEK